MHPFGKPEFLPVCAFVYSGLFFGEVQCTNRNGLFATNKKPNSFVFAGSIHASVYERGPNGSVQGPEWVQTVSVHNLEGLKPQKAMTGNCLGTQLFMNTQLMPLFFCSCGCSSTCVRRLPTDRSTPDRQKKLPADRRSSRHTEEAQENQKLQKINHKVQG